MLTSLQVSEILKDRPSWFRDCRCLDVLSVIPAGNGGTIELIYMQVCYKLTVYNGFNYSILVPYVMLNSFLYQTYAPTTLASARDFWTLRYTTSLEDGSLVVNHLAIFTLFPIISSFLYLLNHFRREFSKIYYFYMLKLYLSLTGRQCELD